MKHFVILSIGLLFSGSAFALTSNSYLYNWKDASLQTKLAAVRTTLTTSGIVVQSGDAVQKISKCIDRAVGPFTYSLRVDQAVTNCKENLRSAGVPSGTVYR